MKTPPLLGEPRILVVASPPLAELISLTLNHGVFERRLTRTVADARKLTRDWAPHMLVVDIGLDRRAMGLVGTEARERLLPTIVLSARGDLRTKLEALDRGADDFLAVPFVPEELLARVFAVFRRTYGTGLQFRPRIRIGDLEMDLLHERVFAGTSQVRLTATELALLYFLAANPGRMLSRSTILDHVWGAEFVADSNLVDRHIRNLRLKLKDSYRRPRYIQTVEGKGYRFLPA
jgi:DNA-binding response OmpR family regulator